MRGMSLHACSDDTKLTTELDSGCQHTVHSQGADHLTFAGAGGFEVGMGDFRRKFPAD